jgi:mannosyltransferase OCH1-like enzyme
MHEISELEIFEEYQETFEVMLLDNVVMASDLARVLIVYELGGVYLDFDQVIFEYDHRLNAFEFVSYTTDEFSFGYLIAETSFIGAMPKHPLTLEMMN